MKPGLICPGVLPLVHGYHQLTTGDIVDCQTITDPLGNSHLVVVLGGIVLGIGALFPFPENICDLASSL
jgi:hypothetical protein